MASALRQKLINKAEKGASSKQVTIGEGDEALVIEVRSPTLAASLEFTNETTDPQERFRSMLRALIACSYDPNTGEKVFDHTDVELFMGLPAVEIQNFMQPVMGAITDLINGAREVAKN